MIKGASMFSSGGIAETYLKKAGVEIIVANELIEKRAEFYRFKYPSSKMISGDIREKRIKDEFLRYIDDEVKFLIATPPCQGMSNLGKNKNAEERQRDIRNFLIFDVIDVIENRDFDYILIENVPNFLKLEYFYNNEFLKIVQILEKKFGNKYLIESQILNSKFYNVPQSRNRAIIKMSKFNKIWNWPKGKKIITLREAIGKLPSLESGEKSEIKHHYARTHSNDHIQWMKHTPTGNSAHQNDVYYPKKDNGERIKGFGATYKRMKWDSPAPTVTMRNDAISSQENVHPGRLKEDGTYSDARVLTLLELFIVSSLPNNWELPNNYSDTFIRQLVGEAIPPKMVYYIIKGIGEL